MVERMYERLYSPIAESIGSIIDGGKKKPQPLPVVETPVITITDTTATITCATDGATIYYTLDGSTPTSASTAYSSAITLTQSCIIKAIAVKSGMTDSEVASENYVAIKYLTAWELVGNSSVESGEIWSCGEYNATDGKYHILVQPQGGSVADIALTEPLRKVNDVADTIEFPSSTEGKALVTRSVILVKLQDLNFTKNLIHNSEDKYRFLIYSRSPIIPPENSSVLTNIISNNCSIITEYECFRARAEGISCNNLGSLFIYDENYNHEDDAAAIKAAYIDTEIIGELATPTTELVDAPQIEQSSTDIYTQVISQGAKAVAWTSFTPNPE